MPRCDFRRLTTFAAVLALGATLNAFGQGPRGKPQPPDRKGQVSLSEEDRVFANKAAAGGIAAVEMAKLAQQISKTAEVKKLAERIVAERGKANEELKVLSAAKGNPLPVTPSRVAMIEMEKVVKLTGAKFDQEYLEDVVEDHKKDVKEFEKQSKAGKDPDLTKWAAEKLPMLQEHLRLAEAAQAKAKGAKKK
jgi:putative membrane protein